jgi:isopentenyl phosphate kinase
LYARHGVYSLFDLDKVKSHLVDVGLASKAEQLSDLYSVLNENGQYVDYESPVDLTDESGKVRYSMTGRINGYTKSKFDELVDAVWDDSNYEIMVTDSDTISNKMQAALDNGKVIMSSSEFLSTYGK